MKTWLYFVLALAALQFAGFSPFGAAYSLVGRTVGIALPRTEHDTCDDSIVTAMKNVTTDFNQVRTCYEAEPCLAHAARSVVLTPCIDYINRLGGSMLGDRCSNARRLDMSCCCSWPSLWASSSQRPTEWGLKLLHSSDSSFRRRPGGLSRPQLQQAHSQCTATVPHVLSSWCNMAGPCVIHSCLQEQRQARAGSGLASRGLQACLSSAGERQPRPDKIWCCLASSW